MSLSDLKPCPFCGCDGWIVEDRGDHSCEPLLYRPQCKMCGGGLGGFLKEVTIVVVGALIASTLLRLLLVQVFSIACLCPSAVSYRTRSAVSSCWTVFNSASAAPSFDF